MASLVIIIPCALALFGTAFALMTDGGRAGMLHSGPHGFTEVLYALTSASNNNGSAFAGLSANSIFYNTLLGVTIFVGRFFVIIPVLAIAGSLAAKNTVPASTGTLPTHTPLFILMLIGVIIIVGLLTYAPSLALGPVVEHLQMISGEVP
jgi:K+-transporting ATPase ATPase A chain